MNFICSTAELYSLCSNVQRAVSTKSSLPAVEGILVRAERNKVYLTGYDLELGISTSMDAKVEEEGALIINAKVVCDILRMLPGETVRFDSDERCVVSITSGEAKYLISGMSATEYPELPTVTGGLPVVMDLDLLKEMVRQTIFAVSTNDAKVVHTGIKFEIEENSIRMISIDGFRLAIRNEMISYNGEPLSFIVPAKTLSEIVKLTSDDEEGISFGIGKRHIIFEVGRYKIVSRLLEGEFMNYHNAIPNGCTTNVTVDTRELLDSIERASLIINDRNKSPIRCDFDIANKIITISSVAVLGTAKDRLSAEIDGNSLEIGFNNKYLIDALRAADTDLVKIELNGPIAPIVIKPTEGDRFIFVVLPVKLRNE
ncbi:MAG: DNA polymerase III subunit beta [Clostridiales bacterium]|nr:DNA polymerase III subunit beta [Clostridiales bacterium]